MWRLIFLGLIIGLIVYIFKRQVIKPGRPNPESKQDDEKHIEDMVKCSKCSVHLPRSEAYLVGGEFYCSKAHIKQQ
jgi:uncharacterized protein